MGIRIDSLGEGGNNYKLLVYRIKFGNQYKIKLHENSCLAVGYYFCLSIFSTFIYHLSKFSGGGGGGEIDFKNNFKGKIFSYTYTFKYV